MSKKSVIRTLMLISVFTALSGCYEEENKLQESIIKELASAREAVIELKNIQTKNRLFLEQIQKEDPETTSEDFRVLTASYKAQLETIDTDIESFSSHTDDMFRTFGKGNPARFATSVLERAEQATINYDRVTTEEIRSDVRDLKKIGAKLDLFATANRSAKPDVAENTPQ
jgi:hypothetical protein